MEHSIYEKYGLTPVINACGKMTALGASCVSDSVGEHLKCGAQEFVVMDDLMQAFGDRMANLLGAEGVCIASSASAGIAIACGAIICGDSQSKISRVPFVHGSPNQIIIQKGHCINYGVDLTQVMAMAGAKIVEIGSVNKTMEYQLRDAISSETAALFYVQSHHANKKGQLTLEEWIAIAKEYGIPVIVDAAAEEDLCKYYSQGADLTIYSGHKAIGGPTSGLIVGKQKPIANCLLQYKGIGRCMKVGKENAFGLMKAVEEYLAFDFEPEKKRQLDMVHYLEGECKAIDGLSTRIIQDEAGREIWRLQLSIDADVMGMTAQEVVEKLENGSPRIFTRNHQVKNGKIGIDPRPIKEGQEKLLAKRLKEVCLDQ